MRGAATIAATFARPRAAPGPTRPDQTKGGTGMNITDESGISTSLDVRLSLLDVAESIGDFRDNYNDVIGALERAGEGTQVSYLAGDIATIAEALRGNPTHDGSADAAAACAWALELLETAREACVRAVDALAAAHDALESVRW